MVTSHSRCGCCGLLLTQSLATDDCPHCGYPIDFDKEEQFLKASLRDLRRVATYSGTCTTVAQLITRYQRRLFCLYKLIPMPHLILPVLPPAQAIQKIKNVNLTENIAHEQSSPEALANIETQPSPIPHTPLPLHEQFTLEVLANIETQPLPTFHAPSVIAHEQFTLEVLANIETQPLPIPHTPPLIAHEQFLEALANIETQPLPTFHALSLQAAPSQLADSRLSTLSPTTTDPITPPQPSSDRMFSLRSFLADQTINIIASLGAFLILLGSLSFIITTKNVLLSLIVLFIVHSLFGISGAISYQFRSFRVVAVIYSAIFALQVPLVGFAAYRLSAGHFIQLDVPILVVITVAYAAIAYGWLALSHKFELYAYLYAISLAIVDLAICSSIHLGYWWWPAMLMLLALPIAISKTGTFYLPQSLAERMAVFNRPVYLLMFTCVGVCSSGVLITALYSLRIDMAGQSNLEIRFAIVSMLLLLLCWTALFIWSTRRLRWSRFLPYLFLACVIAISYAFLLNKTGYALAFTAVAVLYHGLKRFFLPLRQSLQAFGQDLEWVAFGLIALVPWIVSPGLLPQIFLRAYIPSSPSPQMTTPPIVAVVLLLIGLVLTLSDIESHTGLCKAPAVAQRSWCSLLLLSGFILDWTYGIVILSLHAEPAWYFLGLTLLLVALAVAVRRFMSIAWADPLDILALVTLGFTLLLSLNRSTEYIAILLLSFATLSYAITLYQRRQGALFVSLTFGVLALLPLLSLPFFLLIVSVAIPLILPGIYLVISRHLRVDETHCVAFWMWPLLALGPLYGITIFSHDQLMSMSTIQSWLGIPFPLALESAILALAWYISAALARVRVWLFIMMGFAVLALLSASGMFWWLVGIAPMLAILALGISYLADKRWSLPLYGLAALAEVIMGWTGYRQDLIAAAIWALLGFAFLVYLIGVVERSTILAHVLIWTAGCFACWSVYYSGRHGDSFFPPLVALTCAAIGMGMSFFRLVALPSSSMEQRHKLLLYTLPWYGTALFAAILTGVYGVVFGANNPFYGAVPVALLVYALVAYSISLLERKATWLWIAAGFSLWGTLLLPQTDSCKLPLSATYLSFLCVTPIYSLTAVVLVSGLLGILSGRLIKGSIQNVQRSTMLGVKYAWSWPCYLTSLLAIGVTIIWNTEIGFVLQKNVWLSMLGIFIALWLLIMLVERMPEFLLIIAMLAAYMIAQTSWLTWQVMGADSLLCACLFALQFIWRALPPKVYLLSSESLHRLVTIGGLGAIVLGTILQGGLLPHAGMLAHVGTGSLCWLAASLFWYGHVGRLQPLPLEPAVQRLCYYGAGLFPFLVVSWEWLAFGQTDLSLLSIAPATYLIVVSPFLSRDRALPQQEHVGGLCAMSGAAFLLLPTLWSSFSQQNLFPALLLASEALVLCLVGIGMHMRFFVLSGAALVIISAIHILFLPSLGIPSSLALAISGGLLLACASSLMLIRSHLASWSQ